MEPVTSIHSKAIDIMKEIGYNETALGDNGNVIFFLKKINDWLSVHATVYRKQESVYLDIIGVLDQGISLRSLILPIENTERILKAEERLLAYLYIAKGVEPAVKPEKKIEKTLEERKSEFWEKIRRTGKEKEYEKAMCLQFYDYWTQKNEKGKLMRFEKESTWDLPGRLRTWLRNDNEWATSYAKGQERKAEKQNQELDSLGNNIIKRKDLF